MNICLAARIGLLSAAVIGSVRFAEAVPYTWTNYNNNVADQNVNASWTDSGNWQGGTIFVSDPANELVIFADTTTALEQEGSLTITNVPATLSMNTLTLNGRGPNDPTDTTIIVGDSNSTWTIGDGTTSLISYNSTSGGGGDRDVNYSFGPHLILNQALTTVTGVGGGYFGLRFTGNISESASGYGITKSGSSTLVLSGSNTFTGVTTVNGGRLRLENSLSLPGGTGVSGGLSGLTLNGGTLEMVAGSFERNLGSGADQFRIIGGSSGFGSRFAPLLVRVNEDPSTELVWGSANFQPSILQFCKSVSDDTDDDAVVLVNAVDLNGSTRTVQVDIEEAAMLGNIRNSSGTAGLTKSGGGLLTLSGTNTYNGTTALNGGTLSVERSANLGDGSSSLNINNGTLRIKGVALTNVSGFGHAMSFTSGSSVGFDIDNATNSFTVDQVLDQGTGDLTKSGSGDLILNQANTFSGSTTVSGGGSLILDYTTGNTSRLSDSSALELGNGELVLRGGNYTEEVASFSLLSGEGRVSRDGGSNTVINLNTVGGWTAGENLSFSESDIATTDTLNGSSGILPAYITVGSHFAKNSTGGANGPIVALSPVDYTALPAGGGSSTVNYQLTGSQTRSASGAANALRIESSADDQVLNLGSHSITIHRDPAACLLYGGGANNNYTINGTGRILQNNGNQPLIINVYTGVLTVNAIIKDSGSGPLTKAGEGILIAAGNNDYTGDTYVNRGTLRLANNTGVGGDSRGTTVRSGAALELSADINIGAEALNLSGTGVSNNGALRNLSGDNSCGGVITLNGGGARIQSDSGTLTLTGGIVTSGGQTLSLGGAGNIVISGQPVNGAADFIKDGSGGLAIMMTNTVQWSCGSMTLNGCQIDFSFDEPLSETEPVIRVLGDLAFTARPTMTISIDSTNVTKGVQYPLIAVGHRAPALRPTLSGTPGSLKWGGPGDRTLYWDTTGRGTLLMLY